MPRRRVVAAREILPDPKFSSQTIAKFMNHVMQDGKKSIAESIVYGALDRVQEKSKVDPVEFFETTLEKVRPMVEVKHAVLVVLHTKFLWKYAHPVVLL